jgi:poly [ADP-ribose] polymerase
MESASHNDDIQLELDKLQDLFSANLILKEEYDQRNSELLSKKNDSRGSPTKQTQDSKPATNKPPKDSTCDLRDVEVHEDYHCVLNQTDILANNSKFFIVQVLTDGSKYYEFARWGRLGSVGMNKLTQFGPNREAAEQAFQQRFKEKTGNDWDKRKNFTPMQGKYTMLQIDSNAHEVVLDPPKKKVIESSKLPEATRTTLQELSDTKQFEQILTYCLIDTRRLPLGKLSSHKRGISMAREVLQQLSSKELSKNERSELCSKYYTLIPHTFGFTMPPLIEDVEPHLMKMDALEDTEAAMSLVQSSSDETSHPLDALLRKLNCDIEPDHDMTSVIKSWVETKTSTSMGREVTAVLSVKQHDFKLVHKENRQLLWMVCPIFALVLPTLHSGFRKFTGIFGKHIYLTPSADKALVYAGNQTEPTYLVLVEAVLGKQYEIPAQDSSFTTIPSGYDSAIAKGTEEFTTSYVHFGGNAVKVTIPVQDTTSTPLTPQWNTEHVVDDPNQVCIRYLVKVSPSQVNHPTSTLAQIKVKQEVSDKSPASKVDPLCDLPGVNVHEDYNCKLTQVSDFTPSNSKYFIIQVLTDGSKYFCFARWGRAGEQGNHVITHFDTNREAAEQQFKRKFLAKTANEWHERQKFVVKKGHYTLRDEDKPSEDQNLVNTHSNPVPEIATPAIQTPVIFPAPKQSQSLKKSTHKVDQFCNLQDVEVYEDYACVLNQSDIAANNIRFYILQQLTKNGSFWVFSRWGRAGENGQNALRQCDTVNAAISDFKKKFKEKTGVAWASRENAAPVAGKYTRLTFYFDEPEIQPKQPQQKSFTFGSSPTPLGNQNSIIFGSTTTSGSTNTPFGGWQFGGTNSAPQNASNPTTSPAFALFNPNVPSPSFSWLANNSSTTPFALSTNNLLPSFAPQSTVVSPSLPLLGTPEFKCLIVGDAAVGKTTIIERHRRIHSPT